MNSEELRDEICPYDHTQLWTVGSGGSWDLKNVLPISDDSMYKLAQLYQYSGSPWNCRATPLSDSDREYMFCLYYSMQGLVARVRKAELDNDNLKSLVKRLARQLHKVDPSNPLYDKALSYCNLSPLRESPDGVNPT